MYRNVCRFFTFIFKKITHCYEYVKAPNTRHQVEHAQLTRFVELGVLALGEVEAPDDFLRHNNRLCERSHNGWDLNSATVRREGVSQEQKHGMQHTKTSDTISGDRHNKSVKKSLENDSAAKITFRFPLISKQAESFILSSSLDAVLTSRRYSCTTAWKMMAIKK